MLDHRLAAEADLAGDPQRLVDADAALKCMPLSRSADVTPSRGRYDYHEPVATIPAEQAFWPLADGGCLLVR